MSSDRAVSAQCERVVEAASTATVNADAVDLHRMRKRVKELRYLTEVFAGDGARPERKVLKKLQDALGEVQDVAVQREWLTAHSDEVGPIDVRLKELDERDATARIAYGELLAQFFAVAC